MPTNQVFKGDLAEVSMAKETGLIGQGTGNAGGTGATAGWNTTKVGPTANSSTITVGRGMYWVHTDGKMKVPLNMLVGASLRFYATNEHASDNYATTYRSFTITANSATTITIQPRLLSADDNGHASDYFVINGLRIPTFDSDCAAGTSERIKADQFLGLLNSFSLPEAEIDVRKQHIVGMGRDVNVLTSGKETLGGGSYDLNAHSLRFMKYALGGHTAKGMGEYSNLKTNGTLTSELPLNLKGGISKALAAQEFGTGTVDATVTATVAAAEATVTGLVGVAGNDYLIGALTIADTGTDINATDDWDECFDVVALTGGIFKVLSATGAPLLGHYETYVAGSNFLNGCTEIDTGVLARAQTVDMAVHVLASPAANVLAGDIRINLGATIAAKFTAGEYIQIFDKDTVQIPGADVTAPTLRKHEIRRVLAVGTTDGADAAFVYVEEPFLFGHTASSCGVERMQYIYDAVDKGTSKRGSPSILSTGELKYGVEHNFFGYSYLPTFSIEQSFRSTDVTPGANQMLRVYSGCKVNALTFKADSEGEVKISGDYEAGRMFTDTTDKFLVPHRMFENTANSQNNRKVSGIAVDGEKPYLFQHVSMEAFGAPLLRAISAEVGISNSNTARWYIKGTDGAYGADDQVQESATQYSSEITEAAREYTFKFSALVEDSRWFDELRQRKHHINTNDITMTLFKPGSHATRQNALVTIEDYTVMKANHPMPDDKGPVTAEVEFAVRHMKAKETSPYFTY